MDWSFLAPLFITLAVGVSCGFILRKLKVPGGYMIGAFLGVSTLSITTGIPWMPAESRVAVQIVAGAFVGCLFERSDLKRLRRFAKPTTFMLLSFLGLNMVLGFMIWAVSPLDLITSLMSTIPGGVNDIPIVAADMGGDAPKVTFMQLVRLILGVGIFPVMIAGFDRLRTKQGHPDKATHKNTLGDPNEERIVSKQKSWQAVLVTLAVAAIAGILGKMSGVPGLTFTASIAAVLILKLVFNFAYIPRWMKRICQLLAGCYLGTLFTMEGLLGAVDLILPAIILIVGYTLNVFVSGWVESKFFGYGRKEGMLIVSPAGGSEMALVMEDLKVKNTDIIVMQIVRVVAVVAVFPQLVNLVSHLVGG